jgi:hypothetical protein
LHRLGRAGFRIFNDKAGFEYLTNNSVEGLVADRVVVSQVCDSRIYIVNRTDVSCMTVKLAQERAKMGSEACLGFR